jgi:hypothetical protein
MKAWILGVALLAAPLHIMAVEEPKMFTIDHVAQHEWGKLISVYDQPTYQRLTFESDTHITIVQLGLAWDNKENTYRPSIKQVISVSKGEPKTEAE